MSDTATKEFAKKIKKAREGKRWTQSEVAIKARLSSNYYARVERGEVVPSIDTVKSIVKALGIQYTIS